MTNRHVATAGATRNCIPGDSFVVMPCCTHLISGLRNTNTSTNAMAAGNNWSSATPAEQKNICNDPGATFAQPNPRKARAIAYTGPPSGYHAMQEITAQPTKTDRPATMPGCSWLVALVEDMTQLLRPLTYGLP